MPLLGLAAAAGLLGFVSANAWVGWVSRIVDKSPLQAAALDGAIILPSLLVKQIWAYAETSFVIFVGYLIGSVLGTYVGVRWFRRS